MACGVLIALLLIFRPTFPFDVLSLVLFILAACSDYYDGKIAREHHLESDSGKIMDPVADKVLILGVLCALSLRGLFSIWWILPIAVREIWVTAVRMDHLRRKLVISAEWAGKIKTGTQIATIGFAFIHLLTEGLYSLSGHILIGSLMIANAVTIYAGWLFFKNLESHST